MRRALETAYHTFKKHPWFRTIKFIVVPDLREELDSIKGIPGNTEEILEEFSKIIPNLNTKEMKFEDIK